MGGGRVVDIEESYIPREKKALPDELQKAIDVLNQAIKNHFAELQKVVGDAMTNPQCTGLEARASLTQLNELAWTPESSKAKIFNQSQTAFAESQKAFFKTLSQFPDYIDQVKEELENKYQQELQKAILGNSLLNGFERVKRQLEENEKEKRAEAQIPLKGLQGCYSKEYLKEIEGRILGFEYIRKEQKEGSRNDTRLQKWGKKIRNAAEETGIYVSRKDDKKAALERLKAAIENPIDPNDSKASLENVKNIIEEIRKDPKVMDGKTNSFYIAKLLKNIEKETNDALGISKHQENEKESQNENEVSSSSSYQSRKPGF